MKLGCCLGLNYLMPDSQEYGTAHKIIEMGYDYAEAGLAAITALSTESFDALREEVRASGIKLEACNSAVPGDVRLTGHSVDQGKVDEYLKKAFFRADELGVKIIVLGSSKARDIEDGCTFEQAHKQLAEALIRMSDLLSGSDITVVIEPLQKRESNIINTVSEGLALAKEVNRGNIKVLGDYYHMYAEGEDMGILYECGDFLRHLHFAEPEGRVYPKEPNDKYKAFFDQIKKMNYSYRLSMEAGSSDIIADARAALAVLKQYRD